MFICQQFSKQVRKKSLRKDCKVCYDNGQKKRFFILLFPVFSKSLTSFGTIFSIISSLKVSIFNFEEI
jgi:hypothetical protein